MRYRRAIVALLTMSPASVTAATEAPEISDEQMACAATATKGYLTANSLIIQRATANGPVMSVDDTIAKRRLVEDFCKQWAACLSSNVKDAGLREIALRSTFLACLENEAKNDETSQPSDAR
jgi:hypothetical protein